MPTIPTVPTIPTLLAFGASSSSRSINALLARHAADQLSQGLELEITFIDLNDFEMPIFSIDREERDGIPEAARRFKELIRNADGILISLAEHNGSYSAAFKNLLDWSSRIEAKLWLDKPLCLLATSPGRRGGQSVLQTALTRFPYLGSEVISSFSLPLFRENFDASLGVTDEALNRQLQEALGAFRVKLSS